MNAPSIRSINAEHLLLVLVTRKIAARQAARGERACRWAAMSNGASTQRCDRRGGRYRLPHPPLMTPLQRGDLLAAVERTRLVGGLAEVRRTWGCGLRAIQAEARQYSIPAEQRGCT